MIEVRRAQLKDAEEIIDVNLRTWRTTYAGIISDDYLSEREAEKEERIARLRDTLRKAEEAGDKIDRFVAVDNGRIIGFVTYGSYRDEAPDLEHPGEIYAIYVLQEYQGRGIGRELINCAVRDLSDEGFASVVIWALKDNPNASFYKKIGGAASFVKNASFGSQALEEVGFLYDDIKELIEATNAREK